ncbi:hypothetical protein J2X06_001577 [Lysobacter niastensis]|uniref:Uncharacterized protein n=1 Tax=Lysobacter niastensis TaxID=380629 RepID=A0ABU1WA06_9GAMM|nr:hypothetical protein [Lysobacter niastensis]MDR7134393.1 hypothetical protein [Lysobacter niastensis]
MAGMRLAFVLELQRKARLCRDRMRRVIEQRRRAFAERDEMRGVDRIIGIERHQRAKAPQVATLRAIPRRIWFLARQSLEVEHHLDRPAVDRIEVHRYVGGILDARGDTANAAYVGHGRTRSEVRRCRSPAPGLQPRAALPVR